MKINLKYVVALASLYGLMAFAQSDGFVPVRSISEKKLTGIWGAGWRFGHEQSYSEYTLKTKGAYTVIGRNFGQKYTETGTWFFRNGIIQFSPVTVSKYAPDQPASPYTFNLYTRSGRLSFYYSRIRFYKGIRWNFKKKAYFDEKGEKYVMS